MRNHSALVVTLLLALATATSGAKGTRSAASGAALSPSTLPAIATTDERFQSYNVEMAEVIGGNFWKPYDAESLARLTAAAKAGPPPPGSTPPRPVGQDPSMFQARPPIDLTDVRLRVLAAALGPAYMRVSGTWANQVYFHDDNAAPPARPPAGFQGVLTRAQWKGVVDFAHVVNATLVSSFTISAGVRDAAGVWTADQAARLVAYTKSIGGDIAAAEFFNEPNVPSFGGGPRGYNAVAYAKDFAVFRAFARSAAPGMRIVGPGSVGEDRLMSAEANSPLAALMVKTPDMLAAEPRPVFDVFSYHFYGSVSLRCAAMGSAGQTTSEAALSEDWLSRTDHAYDYYVGLRDKSVPGAPVWITETADAACGGNPWGATFLDSFRYLDQMGRLARRGVAAIFHNTLAASEYGLIDQRTLTPRPNYWAALLWHRLMGRTVLDAGAPGEGVHVYAHCTPGRRGGVTLLAVNTSADGARSLELPSPAEAFSLTARTLQAGEVELNGHTLALTAGGEIPALPGKRFPAGTVPLAPASLTFFEIADARNPACAR